MDCQIWRDFFCCPDFLKGEEKCGELREARPYGQREGDVNDQFKERKFIYEII